MVNLVVAFGFAEHIFFINAGHRQHRSYVPDSMLSEINVDIRTPFDFVSIGDGEWFLLGRDPDDPTRRLTRFRTGDLVDLHTQLIDNPSNGVCFGVNNSWTWYRQEGETYHQQYQGLDDKAVALINMAERERTETFKIIIGAYNATVLVFDDGVVWWTSCGNCLSDTLSISGWRHKKLKIRYITLSPVKDDWFFIQFEDGSITWNASDVIGERLEAFAKDMRLVCRKARTLQRM